MSAISKWLISLLLLAGAGAVYAFAFRGPVATGHSPDKGQAVAAGGHREAGEDPADPPDEPGQAKAKPAAGEKDKAEEGKDKDVEASEKSEAEEGRSWATRDAHGHVTLKLDPETREKIGLEVAALAATSRQPEVTAYGQLEIDPARSFTLRAPLGGFLRVTADGQWPELGTKVEASAVVGVVKPRFGAMEQFDLSFKLAEARADVQEQTAQVAASRAAYENKKELNTQGKLVSDRVLEEADAKLKTDTARLSAAGEELKLIEGLFARAGASAESVPLHVEKGGEVVEVLAMPDEAVESGQALLRVARFDQMIARVEIPAGDRVDKPISAARFAVVGRDNWVMTGTPLCPACSPNARSQGQSYLFRVDAGTLPVRPGTAVTAYLSLGGDARTGVMVPRSAVVRYAGLAWVYVQTAEERFERRSVVLSSPTEAGWFVESGIAAGDRVATTGAQVLLSEELKSQIEAEEAASE